MTLEHYTPVGTEVLFEEVREEKTASGLYIPDANFRLKEQHNFWETEKIIYDGSESKLGGYKIVKVGTGVPASSDLYPGDTIILRKGVNPESIELDGKPYFQVMAAYIIGRERKE